MTGIQGKIRFKQMYVGDTKLHAHNILYGSQKIGEINFTKKNNIFVMGYLEILEHHRGNHYGCQVIEYILSHYKIVCIVGESLYDARGFWNKCIKKFNGQRKNIVTCDNCSFSFVIPRYGITDEGMIGLLNIGYEISYRR